MFEGDSFLTLSPAARVGLVLISLALAALWIVAARRAWRGRRFAIRLGVAVAGLWLWDWLTPQVYYLYYQAIFDDLPWQVVVMWPPPGPVRLAELLGFAARPSLADWSRGALGWALIGPAALRRR